MPFKETCPMEERIIMLREYDSGVFTDSELALRFGISRTTFYDWLNRRDTGEPDWFKDRSRAPGHCHMQLQAKKSGRSSPFAAASRNGDQRKSVPA